jgi:hypothetical protein
LHQDRKDLEQQGVRRIEEIFRQLSEKPYSLWRVIDPQKLPSPEPDEDFSPLDLLRFGFPQALSKRISFEQFKELTGNAPREGAIALTADYFGIKKETVRKKL